MGFVLGGVGFGVLALRELSDKDEEGKVGLKWKKMRETDNCDV